MTDATQSTARTLAPAPFVLGRARALLAAASHIDARLLQIAFLASLLVFGALARDFALEWQQVALTFAAGLTAQAIWLRILGLRNVGYLSALVTCFGTSILVRADSYWVHPLVVATAISSKFILRIGNKHLYNPANLAAILAAAVLPGAWVSPGQWGNEVTAALWFVALGCTVTIGARRFDIAWAFLASYVGLLLARLLYLGQPWPVLINQLSSGGLLLFTFFMISDPMTTPNRRSMRLAYALIVAAVAFAWHFVLFRSNGLIWALFIVTPLVPLLDRLLPGRKHGWQSPPATAGR